jgi:hypothetical protein
MSESNYYSDDEECELFGFDDVSDVSEGLKYRSIAVDSGRPSYMGTSAVGIAINKPYTAPKSVTGSSSTCPCAPFGMSKTNFTMMRPSFAVVRDAVDDFLADHPSIDFCYLDGEFMVSS